MAALSLVRLSASHVLICSLRANELVRDTLWCSGQKQFVSPGLEHRIKPIDDDSNGRSPSEAASGASRWTFLRLRQDRERSIRARPHLGFYGRR